MKTNTPRHPPRRIQQAGAMRIGMLLIMAVSYGLGACSLMPSPLIVGNTYTNFEYEYSLDLPEGWTSADDSSQALEHYAPWVDDRMASLVLVHQASEGVIAVLNQKQTIDFPRYIHLRERYWVHRIDELREKLQAEVEVQRFDYRLYKDNLATTQQNYFISQRSYKPEKAFGVEALIIEDHTAKRLAFEWFFYPCQKDRSCQAIVMMTCREDQFGENRPAFDRVVATLRAHDYYN